jgi:hypothetical protein
MQYWNSFAITIAASFGQLKSLLGLIEWTVDLLAEVFHF